MMEGLSIFQGLVALVSFASTLYRLLSLWWTAKLDGREPPVIPSKIPLIGHAIQLLRQGSVHFANVR